MRKILLPLAVLAMYCSTLSAQNITPTQTSEQCPGVNITFTVIIPAQSIQSVQPKALNINPTVIQQPFNLSSNGGNITFSFIGNFSDFNNKQTFTVFYTNPSGQPATWDATFPKIKSLLTANSCSQIQPLPTNITAPICQVSNYNISFNNVQYGNPFEAPQICYGTVSDYEYLLPAGWKLGTTTSNGTTWLPAGSSVTVTSNLLGAGQIAVRPVNSCNSSLQKNQPPSFINITRTNSPVLKINGSTSLTLFCGDATAKTFTVENAGSCITSYEWQVANKGWYDAAGNLITANITTTTPSLTIYPSCNNANPAQNIQVKIKAGAEEITSTVTVTFSTAAPTLTISGPPEFCTSDSYTVPVSAACGASVVWSLEPLNNFPTPATLSCTNCQTTTLTKVNGGTALLRATVTFPNCNSTGIYEKYIGIGVPQFRGWYNSPTNPQEPLNPWTRANMNATNLACYGTYITTLTDITANANVIWQEAGLPAGMQWYQIGNNLRFIFADINQEAFFSVTITNSCGTKSIRYRFTSVGDNCSGGNPLRAQISPNPATNMINVTIADKSDLKKQKEIIEIQLLDKMGNIKQKWSYAKGNANQTKQINVGSLSADIYTIIVFDGVNWTSEKFIKQ